MTHSPNGAYRSHGHRRASRAKRWIIVVASIAVLGLIAWPVMSYFEIPPFTDKGKPVSFGQVPSGGGQAGGTGGDQPADSKVSMPTGPAADFKIASTLSNGTHVGVVSYDGKKSGFKGKVWVWAPKEYEDPKFAKSGFPVLVALPGGPGFPANYWMDDNLKLESSISKWYSEGKSKPFLLAMPVLNPKPDDGGLYWDGSDIPGQPKMGTWLTEDVPDLMKQNFRTINSRDGWAFMGSSSGGFSGLKAVLKHPDKFKAVIASGPDIVPDSPLWKGHEQEKNENNPELLAKALIAANKPGQDVYLAFQYGTLEKSVIPKVDQFIKTYGNKGPIHTRLQVIQGGKHDAKTYVEGMGEGSMQWISEHLEGPVPSS
ncbi:alpha/beta hydrolase-fold protein [Streptomyces sp. NPDC051162]|uniref:alpha/beta hydrolase n=1 Tax=unclassified Streptomyces TaxID=2593676 RepID=UPI00344AF97A